MLNWNLYILLLVDRVVCKILLTVKSNKTRLRVHYSTQNCTFRNYYLYLKLYNTCILNVLHTAKRNYVSTILLF